MKKHVYILLILALLLGGCASKPAEQPAATTEPATIPTTAPTTAPTQATQSTVTPTSEPTTMPTTASTTEPTATPTAPKTMPPAAPTVEPTAPVRDAKHRILRYQEGKNHTDYNDGYEGEEFTTDGMKDGGLYAVNDGEILVITEQYVSKWDRAIVRGPVKYTSHVFYVLRDEPKKVWISDRYGQNQSLLYESLNGEITSLYHHSDTPQILYIAESQNRIIAYDMQTTRIEVQLEAPLIKSFTYVPSEYLIRWSGYLNKSDFESSQYGGAYHYYYYYTNTKDCWMLVNNKDWVLVAPDEQEM
ncbi:MAG: hypothetical protein IJX37_03495 [Oscillospiraceae bacterium]|nr:hypothetical protein [Oscillospiraceae bacterium]